MADDRDRAAAGEQLTMETVLVTGAAGFVGSHLTDRLLGRGSRVVGVDNLSRGTEANLAAAFASPNFRFVRLDLTDLGSYQALVREHRFSTVWHLVANSDIPTGVTDPTLDLRDTFTTTFNTLQVMRSGGIKNLAFASTSAIYGVHSKALTEDVGPLFPISNYGAMKLASEAAISAAVESFLDKVWIFRFPNVVGSRATHGIIYDLMTKLSRNDSELEVLGDGSQQKPYLHVSELIDALLVIYDKASEPRSCFNIGPADEGTTVKDIARAVIRRAAPNASIRFTGGNRGWIGDVPRFHYSIDRIERLGWRPRMTSQQAIELAVTEIHQEFSARTLKSTCSSSS